MATSFYAYAKAIYELTDSKDAQNDWLEYLEILDQISKEKIVSKLFLEPDFSFQNMYLLVEKVVSKRKNLSLFQNNFLKIILKNKRFFDLKKIIQAFQTILYEKNDIAIATIKSSTEISSADLKHIKDSLKARLNKEIQTQVELRDDLIGVQIYVGHYHFDYTIETVVEKMKQKILKG
jgi:ATP synthase F1 delta subunit